MKKMGLKKKLFLFLSFCMVVPALLLQVWFYFDSASKTKELFFEKIKNISLSKEIIIEHYFDSLSDNLQFIVAKESFVSAFKEMQESYLSYLEELGPYDFEKIKKEVAFFSKNEFLEKYNKENPLKKIESVDFLLEKMQEKQILLQYYYIVKNANKIGQKDKLLTAETKTKFDLLHEKIHQDYKSFLEKFSLYDLFFIEAETGVILYSVFKELDFATSVTVGPYAQSGIGEIFKKLVENSKKGEKKTIFQDLSLYFPSYNAPAGFMGVPVYEKEKFLGVVVIQLPIEKLNQIMESEEKNEALDFYVVGQDFLPRVDAKLDKEKKNVISAFKDVENGKIFNSALKKSFESNKVEYAEEKNYIGEEALQVALPMNIYGNNWRVVVSLNKKEMNAQLQALSFKFIIQIVLIALASFVVALFLTRPLSMEMQKIEEMLSQEVLAVKQQSLVMTEISHKLSSASHEQAAGLQETVASVDEISAMIARNADSADNSSKTSQKSTQTAQEGKAKVENMLKAIDSIAENNQGIVKQIEHSNEEISTIVEVIQEISGKTKIINDIVFQTKLLSFNASVEAARAGEHGKGFAVVAEEVGNLASMSGKASTEISALLEKSVKRVTEIVDSSKGLMKNLVATSREKIEIGHESAKSCASSLDQILQNVSSVDEMVKEIATASREQAAGVSEINKAMSELDQVTQANSSLAQESSTVAEKLNKQTQLFSEIVQRLKDFLEGANSNSSITPVKKTATVKEKKKEIKKTKEAKLKNVEKQDNVIALKPAQENQKSVVEKVEKKVVGLEFEETPLANDSRFEDI